MKELNEVTDGKNLTQLKVELSHQLEMGNSIGGQICSHIIYIIKIQPDFEEFNLKITKTFKIK